MAIYNGKHVVFEEVGVYITAYIYNSASNKDGDDCANDYEISDIRNTLSQIILPALSNDLTAELVSTTVQTAKNGISSTLISTTDKLFLPANKEVGYTDYSRTEENTALTTWQYYATHTSSSDHIKYDSTSTAQRWWLRSPCKNTGNNIVGINTSGYSYDGSTWTSNRHISSCFAF